MNIKFANGKTIDYTNAFALENDYCKGIKRPSLTVHISAEKTNFAEIDELTSNAENLAEIVLIGDEQPVYAVDENGNIALDENGQPVVVHYETPTSTYTAYDIKGKITVDDEEITFKLFKKSDLEIENEEAIATIDELLIAMEV